MVEQVKDAINKIELQSFVVVMLVSALILMAYTESGGVEVIKDMTLMAVTWVFKAKLDKGGA